MPAGVVRAGVAALFCGRLGVRPHRERVRGIRGIESWLKGVLESAGIFRPGQSEATRCASRASVPPFSREARSEQNRALQAAGAGEPLSHLAERVRRIAQVEQSFRAGLHRMPALRAEDIELPVRVIRCPADDLRGIIAAGSIAIGTAAAHLFIQSGTSGACLFESLRQGVKAAGLLAMGIGSLAVRFRVDFVGIRVRAGREGSACKVVVT